MRRFRRFAVRASVAWGATLAYLVVTFGAPLTAPLQKDFSQPFLCMHSNCGCRTAEQCYRSCCCHSAAERIAFAKANGLTTPPQLVQEGLLSTASKRQVKSCCANQSTRACQPTGKATAEASEPVPAAMKAAFCRGPARYWLMAGAALPLAVTSEFLFFDCVALTTPAHFLTDSLVPSPPTPPPRIG